MQLAVDKSPWRPPSPGRLEPREEALLANLPAWRGWKHVRGWWSVSSRSPGWDGQRQQPRQDSSRGETQARKEREKTKRGRTEMWVQKRRWVLGRELRSHGTGFPTWCLHAALAWLLLERPQQDCLWLELRQAQRKDMPPAKAIKTNPNYWILSASCN